MLLLIFTLTHPENISTANQYIVNQANKLKKINVQLDPCDADLAKMENYDKCINSLSNDIKQLSKIIKYAKQERKWLY